MKQVTQFIKDNYKDWLIWVMASLILVFIAYLIYSRHQSKKAKAYQEVYNQALDTTRKETNTLGDTVYVRSTRDVYNTPEDTIKKIRELAQMVNATEKELRHYTSLVAEMKANPAVKHDTVFIVNGKEVRRYTYKDPWISYTALAGDSLVFDPPLMVRDSISIFLLDKKVGNKLFKEARVINYSPYSAIQNLRDFDFEVNKTPSRWGIGISGGATYYNHSVQPYIGIGLNYQIIQFNK